MQNKENADPLAATAVEAARLLVSKNRQLSRCECCGAFIPSYETPSAAACSCIVCGHQNECNRA